MRYWTLFLMIFLGWVTAWAQPFTFEVALSEIEAIPGLETSPFVRIDPDRGNFGIYRPGDSIILSVFSEREGYVSVFDYAPHGEARILKNNEFFVAGSQRKIYGIVTEPEGTERFLVVLTPRVIPDRLLVEAMRRPTRLRQFLGENIHIQHCAIQVVKERTFSPSFLHFDQVPQEAAPGTRIRLRVFLGDEVGNALVNRYIHWEVNEGELEKRETLTNTFGYSEVWYTAPALPEDTEVVVRACFEGDMVYGASVEEVRFLVKVERSLTVLELSPAVFRVGAEETIDFEATLRDVQGRPLEGEIIRWVTSAGSLESTKTVTNALGKARNRLFAPKVEVQESVEIRASFGGTSRLLPSEGYATGTVSGTGVYLGESFYFLDLSSGRVRANFEDLAYQGRVEKGFFENPVFALLLGKGDFVEASFFLSQPLRAGALYIWGRVEDEGTLRVYVNGQLSFAGRVQRGKGGPLDVQVVSLAPFLELGKNTLRVEFDPGRDRAPYALQRILVVF